jgi:tRNA pseudouridine13 synthase
MVATMPTFVSHHLPGTGGRLAGADCEEVPRSLPGGGKGHVWVRTAKHDLSTQQCRAAIARAVGIDAERVATAGSRDRRGRCVQWFSIPEDLVEHPQSLRNAGYQSKVKVLDVATHVKPIDVVGVERLRWKARLAGAAADDGYRRARAIVDHLRQVGCPNYVHASQLGDDAQFARWGRMLLEGKRLPAAVTATGVTPGRCLYAAQFGLFNRWLARRIEDGLLGRCLPGDVLRTVRGEDAVATDQLEHWQKRMESWEVTPQGPLFGEAMPQASGEALAREEAILAEAGLDAEAVRRLQGGRRAARIQPGKALVDIDGKDLLVSCELPVDAYLAVVMEEIAKPEGHF